MRNGESLTRCGNETLTYTHFVKSLIDQKLIKHIRFYNPGEGQDNKIVGNHQGTLLVGKYSGNEYILDSWYDGGGKMARIVSMEDFKNGNHDANVVPGTKGWEDR